MAIYWGLNYILSVKILNNFEDLTLEYKNCIKYKYWQNNEFSNFF